jgi:prepilin-type N-terminal cleavage/methylation domain-containing protein
MRFARRGQAGFTLIEVTIVLALTLIIAGVAYRVTRANWLLYRTQTHVTERGSSGLRALDDMAVEIARAGFGLGSDAGPLFPGTRDGARAADAITLRSNPAGVVALLGEDLAAVS